MRSYHSAQAFFSRFLFYLLPKKVLAMTMAEPGSRTSLKYKLEGTKGDLGRWGHEFLRSLAGEIGQEYSARRMKIVEGDGEEEGVEGAAPKPMDVSDVDMTDLFELVDDIVPFHLQHNAEAEAVDLLVEVQVNKYIRCSVVCDCGVPSFGMC